MAVEKEFRDILVVGHYSHDELVTPAGEVLCRLGGPPAYISSVLHALDADYSIVAKVGRDFRYSAAVHREPIVAPHAPTTACFNDYSGEGRRQAIPCVCDPIGPGDIRTSAKVCLACGMVGEILPDTVRRLRGVSQILIGDLQGFVRVVREDGTVSLARLADTVHANCVEEFDFLKASREELGGAEIESLREHTTVIVTRGEGGCTLHEKESEVAIPGFAVPVSDPTGAGDCFLAGFGYALSKGVSVREAARMGNYCGSLAVQYVGVPELRKKHFRRILDEIDGLGWSG
jgi:1D-myo-inositol 3-kinase